MGLRHHGYFLLEDGVLFKLGSFWCLWFLGSSKINSQSGKDKAEQVTWFATFGEFYVEITHLKPFYVVVQTQNLLGLALVEKSMQDFSLCFLAFR